MTPACSFCNRAITGRYLKYEDGTLCCESCQARLPRCDRCDTPTRTGDLRTFEAGGQTVRLCPGCWEETDRCFSCGIPLTGEYFVNQEAPDRKFCRACMDRRERCDFCGLPVPPGTGTVYPDGRLSCESCRATAVLDLAELLELETEARSYLKKRFALTLRPASECPVRLADADRIARLQSKQFTATPGFDPRERGLFTSNVRERLRDGKVVERTEDLTIWIETGLPRNDAYGTVVHELAHLWQFDHFPGDRDVDRRWVEGVACWLQHHALKERGAEAEARRVAENPDPIYGGGFRQVQEIEKRVGPEQILDAVLAEI